MQHFNTSTIPMFDDIDNSADTVDTDKQLLDIILNDCVDSPYSRTASITDTPTHKEASKPEKRMIIRNIKPKEKKLPTETKDCRIDYEILQWIFIILFTLIAVIDRFTLNLWPLWVDSPGPTIPGNVGVSVFALIGWISSRMMLVSSSYIFLFQNWVFWNWFCEQRIINKYIAISNIHSANSCLHFHIGWALIGIPVVLHVWSILFAASFPQNSIKLYPNWMRPNNADGTSIPFYANNLLSCGINDIYRIISTSITFFILIPYSVIKCFRNRNWSFAQWLHLLGATIYTVDLIRMTSHPHCWVFNLPFILWWIIDRIYGILYYRRCVAKVVKRVQLDDKYTILYLRIPPEIHALRNIGDVFYFNILDPEWDRAHPFTIFWNHKCRNKMVNTCINEHKFNIYKKREDNDGNDNEHSVYAMSRQSTVNGEGEYQYEMKEEEQLLSFTTQSVRNDDDTDEYNWDLGIIMQVFSDHKSCFDHRKTWTKYVFDYNIRSFAGFKAWGPYRSEFRVLMKDVHESEYPSVPLVLIATGAGCSYLLDFYQYITSRKISLNKATYFYFSTRSIAMFQWFTDITCSKHIHNLFVNAHLTSHDNICYNVKVKKSRDSKIGRLNIEEILAMTPSNTNVFYCGSPNVQNMLNLLCKTYNLKFHAGHSFY